MEARWIAVHDQLPQPGQKVICWNGYTKMALTLFFYVNEEYPAPGHFVDIYGACRCEEIAFWMPIPELPDESLWSGHECDPG